MSEINIIDNINLLKTLPFYNVLIDFMSTPRVKRLTNVEFLNELPFYDALTIREISQAFSRYARRFSIEIIDKKDPLAQLNSSEASIKDLFNVLLHEMRGFKYVITINVTLHKNKGNNETEYASVYFNSFIKTVINHNFEDSIDKCFEEILYRIDNWVNQGSGRMVDRINSEYLNISKYSPLFGSTYVELPNELNHSKKGLINISNNDNRCFFMVSC